MLANTVVFRIDFTSPPSGAGGVWVGTAHLEVNLYFGATFHGIGLSHPSSDRQFRGKNIRVISRSTVGEPSMTPQRIGAERYELYTSTDEDPLLAAARAATHHLEALLPPALDDRGDIAKILEAESEHLMHYRDQVVEPVRTAILGMCREPALLHSVRTNGTNESQTFPVVRAIGVWRLSVLAPNALSQTLQLGSPIHDVLVVPEGAWEKVNEVLR